MEIPGQHPNQPADSLACLPGSSPGQTTPPLARKIPETLEMRLDPIRLPGLAIEMIHAQDRDTQAKVREANLTPGVEDLIRSKLKSLAREASLPAEKSDRIRQNLISKASELAIEVQDEQDPRTRSQTRGASS
jgi:hypothetical protein